MHGYSRLNTSRSTVSQSPPASPRHRQLRSRSGCHSGSGNGGFSVRDSKQSSIMEKLVFLILSAVFRRKGLLLFAPLLYISMMLLYMGSLNFDVSISNLKTRVVSVNKRAPPGSVYRSPQVFEKLWPFMEAESRNSTTHALSTAWNSRVHHVWKPCISRSTMTELPKSNGFLIIEANGGLNQQRLSKLQT